MNADYIRTARAKGLSERTVVVRHAFRNALIPLATIVPIDVALVFGGAIITERIFSWRGMGTMFIEALGHGDIYGVMGYFVVTAVLAIAANIVADLIYAGLDPRIRMHA
jgi:peptide/nickel transport system permease protein